VSSQPHEPDFKNIWQSQETEKAMISVEDVRRNAQRFLRRKYLDLIARSAFVVLTAVFCGVFFINARFTSLRLLAGLVMAILLASTIWSLHRAYTRSRGYGFTIHAGPDAAMTSCLEFYRSELERQLEFARQPAWQIVTALLIIAWMTRDALMRNSTEPFRAVLPYVLFAAAGMIVLAAVRKVQSRRVQEDMDALDLFEEEILSGGSHDATLGDDTK